LIYRVLADAVVLLHFGVILFIVLGGLSVLRWRWMIFVHLPFAVWGVAIELGGWICPLTPLENDLRAAAGGAGYDGGFVEHYVIPVVYPAGLTRGVQFALAGAVLLVNVAVYAWVVRRWLTRRRRRDTDAAS
jgi:hypothetical protein